jgi:hypothetical protein
MEAIGTQPTVSVRSWRLIVVTALMVALLIGGASGYVVRLVTAGPQTLVQTITRPGSTTAYIPSRQVDTGLSGITGQGGTWPSGTKGKIHQILGY